MMMDMVISAQQDAPAAAGARAGGATAAADERSPAAAERSAGGPVGRTASPASSLGMRKPRKACINCRRQKMKCIVDAGNSCRRCLRAGVPCVYVPRANAASWKYEPVHQVPSPTADRHPERTITAAPAREHDFAVTATPPTPHPQHAFSDIFQRLDRLEQHAGLSKAGSSTPGSTPRHPAFLPPPSLDDGKYDRPAAIVNTTTPGDSLSTSVAAPDLPPPPARIRSLWSSIRALQSMKGRHVDRRIWGWDLIDGLYHSFYQKVHGLHFLPENQGFLAPNPIFLAAVLYFSSFRGSPREAAHARDYFVVLCDAISQLCVPLNEFSKKPADPLKAEEWAFQTILGIILAGLLREGVNKETGVWISIAYRLLLEQCPSNPQDSHLKWQKLFIGLQIVDLEHASVYLSCPVIPLVPPFASLRPSAKDHLYRLSQMMHTGLTHFTGRGLSTIRSCFADEDDRGTANDIIVTSHNSNIGAATTASSNGSNTGPHKGSGSSASTSAGTSTNSRTKGTPQQQHQPFPFSAVDAVVIRDWARQLDDWLVEFSASHNELPPPRHDEIGGSNAGPGEGDDDGEGNLSRAGQRKLIFRQYVLHRVLVLSIYLPARGCDLFAGTTPKQQHELLVSARAAVKLQVVDDTIWASFDLLVITWAALIVIQGIQVGVCEPDDLDNVHCHLGRLRLTSKSSDNALGPLAARLEQELQGLNTATMQVSADLIGSHGSHEGSFDPSWYIFDGASLQSGYDIMTQW